MAGLLISSYLLLFSRFINPVFMHLFHSHIPLSVSDGSHQMKNHVNKSLLLFLSLSIPSPTVKFTGMHYNVQSAVSLPTWLHLVLGTTQNVSPPGSASRLCIQGEHRCVSKKEDGFPAAAVLCLQIGFQEI